MPKARPFALATAVLLVASGGLSSSLHAAAAPTTPPPAATPHAPVQTETSDDSNQPEDSSLATEMAKMRPQQGDITLGDGLAKLHVPDGFRFYGPEDTVHFLVLLGNPRVQRAPLGMIMPVNGAGSGPTWFAVLNYEENGYVSDHDADTLDYNALLKQMQEGAREESKERVAQGLQGLELVGWAEPPRYDKDTKKLYWAKDIRFTDEKEDTLNYNIRMLGRRGVLVLNCVAGLAQIPEIRAATPQLLGMVEFNQGHRYVDFNPKTDKTAAYGLAALIAGGVAAKAGLFKVLLAGLLAAKKFVVLGVLALAAFVKRLFSGGGSRSSSNQGAS